MATSFRSYRGHFLVAVPKMVDPNFSQTVTLMLAHDSEQALGLVLNRPSQTTLREAWQQLDAAIQPTEGFLHLGGPCQQVLSALHDDVTLSNLEVMPGLYFTQEAEKLRLLVQRPSARIRCFVGYAGWGAGQLEAELREGVWLTAAAAEGDIFGDPTGLWERWSKRLARSRSSLLLGIKDPPPDPSLN